MWGFKALLKTPTLVCRSLSSIKVPSDTWTYNLFMNAFHVHIHDRKRGCNHTAVSLVLEHGFSATMLSVFSGPVFGGSKQITASPVREGLYLLGMHSGPWCRSKKWLQHKASNKYLRSQASADNKPDWINSIEIALRLFPGKINTYRSYIWMI